MALAWLQHVARSLPPLLELSEESVRGVKAEMCVPVGAEGGMADPSAPIRNLFQNLPPLLSTIHDQTGMAPPSWLAQMPKENAVSHEKQRALRNGSE